MELRPEALVDEIEAASDWIYRELNNGVYRCGFSTTQVSAMTSPPCPAATRSQRRIESAHRSLASQRQQRPTLARCQAAYDLASTDVLSALNKLEAILAESQFIVGDKLTEADVR